MRVTATLVVALLTACACGPGNTVPPQKDPPQVFLISNVSALAGTRIPLSVNVNGCDQVAAITILHNDTPIQNVTFQGNPTSFEIPSTVLGTQYASLGIAAKLSLVAKATCDDGRNNTSQPTPLKFFPVARVTHGPGGSMALPDTYYAEGGLAGAEPSFIGCNGLGGGRTGLARVDSSGNILAANENLPFNCSYYSTFTDKNWATGKRWLWERGVGAFAFDGNLNVTSVYLGDVYALGVATNGDAILIDKGTTTAGLKRVIHACVPADPCTGPTPNYNVKWTQQPNGILMGNPIYRPNLDTVVSPLFENQIGTYQGDVVMETRAFKDGAIASSVKLATIDYGYMNAPTIPNATFNVDGSIVYFPFQTGSDVGTAASQVLACSTVSPNCTGAARKWVSPTLTGVTQMVFPFNNFTLLAAIGDQNAWFLDAATGAVQNHGAKPINPDGALVTLAVQPGLKTDFYLLNGPAGGFPNELVAIDSPSGGELLRYSINGGTLPTDSMNIAIDDAGQAWMRIGLDLVKPLKLSEYRQARGPTP